MRLAATLLLLLPLPALAQELPALDVVAAPPLSATEREVERDELLARPVARVGELLEAAPGLIVTQHSGEGKANQYFLRGFNLDHGTDLAISVDGMPVNMPTHGHGQGYADLNFLIPEALAGLSVRKGPFAAEHGDFATAGALRLGLADTLRPFAQASYGSYGYWRGVAGGSMRLGEGNLLGMVEAAGNQGPWQRGEHLHRLNALLRYSRGTEDDGLTVTAMAYAGRWTSTDQIPERAAIGRYGTLDPSDGGNAQRYSLSARWARSGEWGTTAVSAYAIHSRLNLWNNFTYALDDPERGDQFRQSDRRWVMGFDARHSLPTTLAGLPLTLRAGIQGRYDDIALGLFRTQERAWLSTVRADRVREGTAGLWADATLTALPWLRLTAGLRGDVTGGRVRSDLAANSGTAQQAMLSPKLGLVLGPFLRTEFFAQAGTGFHSNDLRGATIIVAPGDRISPMSRVPVLVRARGVEIGLRSRPAEGLELTLSGFLLTLGSEILFVGDAGTTEAGRPSRRLGVEATARWQPTPWLALDGEIAATQARFTDTDPAGNRIPGAPALIATAGIRLGREQGWFAGARLRHFGERPLVEDNSTRSRATTLVNGRVGYAFGNGVRAQLDGLNLLNARGSQIEYFYTSRLPGEPTGGVAGRHLHPAEPLSLRLTVTVPL
ncbi:TonB-dependent receptor [Rhodovarius crocodyli]|uniref:TonB-dependent receptor n=1 Tax=Rhodovarius crocodyli TaxID=1979269 RepID=A0A437MH64_9PROT|nr:TonB-dependent receptor [Rhodovarius crocodyli]RVT96935.1 TonB-dependent receptor [Rhodovarius crocodyli]